MKIFQNPRQLLIFDAIGALCTAILTAAVLGSEAIATGIPFTVLIAMAAAAALISAFGFAAFRFAADSRPPLRSVAVVNILYAFGAVIICVYFFGTLTILGAIYFAVEVAILFTLSTIEFRAIQRTVE